MKVTATETIRYVLGVGEHSSVVGWKKLYVDLGREKLVEYSGGTTWFFHTDHLGSPKVKTAVNGTEAERWDHYPYGETWVPGGSGDQHRYTGHLRDAESGNDFAGAVPATGAAIGRGPGVARASRPGWTVGADRPGPSPGKELPAGQENPSLDAG
jgi:hypothetical protein